MDFSKIEFPFSTWLHPNYKLAKNKDFKTALIILYMGIGVLALSPIYDYFYFVKNPNSQTIVYNYLFKYVAAILSIIFARFSKNISFLLLATLFYVLPSVANSYLTGGIFSMRIFWLIVFLTYGYVFATPNWGAFLTVIILGYLTFLYLNDFT